MWSREESKAEKRLRSHPKEGNKRMNSQNGDEVDEAREENDASKEGIHQVEAVGFSCTAADQKVGLAFDFEHAGQCFRLTLEQSETLPEEMHELPGALAEEELRILGAEHNLG